MYAVICMLVMMLYYHWTNLQSDNDTIEVGDMPKSNKVKTMNHRKRKPQSTDLNIGGKLSIKMTSAWNTSSDDQVVSDKAREDQILRDSIEIIHSSNYNKPNRETCQKRLPSAIIIGVKKSGTRELLDFMHLHPHIQIFYNASRSKYEMTYFSDMYQRSVNWFKEQMPCSFSNQITVMKMAKYFHDGDVPQRIHKLNESIKLILIVREPIARAYSAYTFFNRRKMYSKPFSHFVINSTSKEVQAHNIYVKLSVYDDYMKFWLKYFNLSQFLILEHGEFIHDPVTTLKKVEQFLGLGEFITSDMFAFNSEKGFYCIKSNLTTTGMSCYGEDRGRPQEPITRETKSKLTQYFHGRNLRFFDIIGKSYDW